MEPSLYQDDLNIEPVILWIHTPYKLMFFDVFRVFSRDQHCELDIIPLIFLSTLPFP